LLQICKVLEDVQLRGCNGWLGMLLDPGEVVLIMLLQLVLAPLEVDVPDGGALFEGHRLLALASDVPPVLRVEIQRQPLYLVCESG
jgi:hypothetical protein